MKSQQQINTMTIVHQPPPFPQQQQQHHHQQQSQETEKRIFVSQPGSESFFIASLKGESEENWEFFRQDICQALSLPKSSKLQITLAGVNANITSPKELQSNDKIIVQPI